MVAPLVWRLKVESQMFKYKADILPISLVTLSFLADFAVFLLAPWYIALPWAIVGLAPKMCICAWHHHHQHVATFKNKYLNRALESIYAVQTGAMPLSWELHHNAGHHVNYLDQTKDESAWKTKSGRTMGWLEYSLVVSLTAYPRMWRKAEEAHPSKRHQFVLWAVIVSLMLTLAFLWNPLNTVIIYLVPMAVGLFVTAWHTYYHHAGLDTDDEYAATWNILHDGYNVLTGNLGYHTAHHVRCTVHWSELPAFHAKIAHRIPPHLYRRPCFPFVLLGKSWYPAGHPKGAPAPVAAK